jgi:transcriptional regulator with XRE-family HTH domain
MTSYYNYAKRRPAASARNAFRLPLPRAPCCRVPRSPCLRCAARGPGVHGASEASGDRRMTADTNNPARHFGREVRRARLAAKMTLAGFGQALGYDPGQISRVERDIPGRARRTPAHREVRPAVRQGLSRARRLVRALLPGEPAVGRHPAMVPELDRGARTACGQPADMAAVITVRATANRGLRVRAAANVPRRDGHADRRASGRSDGPAGDPHPR